VLRIAVERGTRRGGRTTCGRSWPAAMPVVLGGPARAAGHAAVADGHWGSCGFTREPRTVPATAATPPTWVDRIKEAHLSRADVYVYFNNDPAGPPW